MSQFFARAEQLLEIAQQVSAERDAGSEPVDIAVLIHHTGAMTIVQDAARPLGALQDEYGAFVAYRITEDKGGAFSITGRTGGRTFEMASGEEQAAAAILPPAFPRYLLK